MRVVLCTCPVADAENLARALVDGGAACVNILPGVTSVYRWKGELQKDEEALLVIKSAVERLGALRDVLDELHPYELPEWVVLGVDEKLTSAAYREWVRDAPRGPAR